MSLKGLKKVAEKKATQKTKKSEITIQQLIEEFDVPEELANNFITSKECNAISNYEMAKFIKIGDSETGILAIDASAKNEGIFDAVKKEIDDMDFSDPEKNEDFLGEVTEALAELKSKIKFCFVKIGFQTTEKNWDRIIDQGFAGYAKMFVDIDKKLIYKCHIGSNSYSRICKM